MDAGATHHFVKDAHSVTGPMVIRRCSMLRGTFLRRNHTCRERLVTTIPKMSSEENSLRITPIGKHPPAKRTGIH